MTSGSDPDPIARHAAPAPPLPPPSGPIVDVADVASLGRAIAEAAAGTTILIADGRYRLTRPLELTASGVAIRSASGRRDAVTIDGAGADLTVGGAPGRHAPALLRLKRAARTTIAHLTFANSPKYGVMFYGDSGVHDLVVHDVAFRDIWVRGLKGTHPARPDDRDLGDGNHPPEAVERLRPRGGVVRHCLFTCRTAKTDRDDGFDGDYISGIDCMGLRDWRISDNVFAGLRGANGGGRAAIFVWQGCDDIVCERNLIVDCDRGISFGNPSQESVSVRRGVIRDNRIVGGVNFGIECCTTRDAEVTGNVVLDAGAERRWAVGFHRGNHGARFAGNALEGALLEDGTVDVGDNRLRERHRQ